MKSILLGFLLFAVPSAWAQTTTSVPDSPSRLEVGAAVLFSSKGRTFATGDTHRIVTRQLPAGFALSVAYRRPLGNSPMGVRYHLGALSLQGREATGMHDGLMPRQFCGGFDLDHEKGRWYFFGGPLLLRWRVDSKATDPLFVDRAEEGGQNQPRGTKFGGRLGIEYRFSSRFAASLAFTQSEFNKNLNPAWLSLGLTCRFR